MDTNLWEGCTLKTTSSPAVSKRPLQTAALAVRPAQHGQESIPILAELAPSSLIHWSAYSRSYFLALKTYARFLSWKKKRLRSLQAAHFGNLLKLILFWMQGWSFGGLSVLVLVLFPVNCSVSPIFDLQSDVPNSGTGIILITIAHSYLIIFKHPDPL